MASAPGWMWMLDRILPQKLAPNGGSQLAAHVTFLERDNVSTAVCVISLSAQVRSLMAQILDGLRYLHAQVGAHCTISVFQSLLLMFLLLSCEVTADTRPCWHC